MRALLNQVWRIFWTLVVTTGVTTGVYRVDHSRAEKARAELIAALGSQSMTQLELLTAPGSLQTTDRWARAVTILNSGTEAKPLAIKLRTALEEDTLAPRVSLQEKHALWSKRIDATETRAVEMKWLIPESLALGATSIQDADLRVAFVFLTVFFALWFLGRGLFARGRDAT